MKKKYIIGKDKNYPITSKIEQYQDFDRLMQTYHTPLSTGRLLMRWIGYSASFIVLTLLSISSTQKVGKLTQSLVETSTQVPQSEPQESYRKSQVTLHKREEEQQIKPQKKSKPEDLKKLQPINQPHKPTEISEIKKETSLSDKQEKNTTSDTLLLKPLTYEQAEPLTDYPTLYKFLAENLKYPKEALKDSLEGTVKVHFLISPTGEITNAEIIQSLSEAHDREAQRVVLMMPPWKPARLNGKIVPSRIVIPLTFKINK